MRGGRTTAAAAACLVAITLLPNAAAHADDATPSPSPTATASAEPAPTPTPQPTVTPTTPPPPTAAPTTPSAPPPRIKLPLKKGHTGPMVAMAQERLTWLGYRIGVSNVGAKLFGESTRTIVKRFQTKFFLTPTGVIDKRTWELIKDMASPIGVLPKACTEVAVALCADKTAKLIRYVVKGKVKLTLDARFGLPGMDTGEGYFTVNRKSRDHVSSLYRTWMPFAMFFNGGEAVHYSPYFDADGYNGGSHGCIGVRDIKMAAWLFDRVPMGARVYVYRS